ncbi:MAG: DUF1858 domain-containing protein [Candidatus Micrarchaeia archaeon]
MAMEISRKTPIGELVLNHPVSASILLEHGFHCIGCGLAAYETIEEGAAAHGFDDAAINALVQEIKDAARKEEELLSKVDDSLGTGGAASPHAKMPAAKESQKPEKGGKKKSKSG